MIGVSSTDGPGAGMKKGPAVSHLRRALLIVLSLEGGVSWRLGIQSVLVDPVRNPQPVWRYP